MSETVLSIKGLVKSYGAVPILRGIDLDVSRGEVVSIIGSSGSGKTTLLRCINLLEEYQDGHIEVAGETIGYSGDGRQRKPLTERTRARQRALTGMAFQQFNLFPHMTALGNVMEGLVTVKRLNKARAAEMARGLLAKVGLAEKAGEYPARLSGGQKQRVAIARALVVEPTVMLMDEPLAAVDAQTRADLEDLVLALRDRYDMTVAMVTHDIDEAVYVADRVIVLAAHPGRLIADIPVDLGRRDQLTTKAEPEFVKRRAEVFTLVRRPAATSSAGSDAELDGRPSELKA